MGNHLRRDARGWHQRRAPRARWTGRGQSSTTSRCASVSSARMGHECRARRGSIPLRARTAMPNPSLPVPGPHGKWFWLLGLQGQRPGRTVPRSPGPSGSTIRARLDSDGAITPPISSRSRRDVATDRHGRGRLFDAAVMVGPGADDDRRPRDPQSSRVGIVRRAQAAARPRRRRVARAFTDTPGARRAVSECGQHGRRRPAGSATTGTRSAA